MCLCSKWFQNSNEAKIKHPLATKFILVAMGLRRMPASASQRLRPTVSVTWWLLRHTNRGATQHPSRLLGEAPRRHYCVINLGARADRQTHILVQFQGKQTRMWSTYIMNNKDVAFPPQYICIHLVTWHFSSAVNSAIVAEMGRFPMALSAIKSNIRFWYHINSGVHMYTCVCEPHYWCGTKTW